MVDLTCCVRCGIDVMRKRTQTNEVSSVLLFTDGQANAGPSTPQVCLLHMVRVGVLFVALLTVVVVVVVVVVMV